MLKATWGSWLPYWTAQGAGASNITDHYWIVPCKEDCTAWVGPSPLLSESIGLSPGYLNTVLWIHLWLVIFFSKPRQGLALQHRWLSHNLVILASLIGALVQVLAALLPIQLLLMYLERQQMVASGTWATATHVGDTKGVPGSCLCPARAMAVVAIWGVQL